MNLDIKIRPVVSTDIPALIGFDHSFQTDYVWQMDFQNGGQEVTVKFREMRLPRSVRVDYPRRVEDLANTWKKYEGLLVAEVDQQVVGYTVIVSGSNPQTYDVIDLVTYGPLRGRGVATALLRAGHSWAADRSANQVRVAIQSKNFPAIQLVQKLGYEFSGFSDKYFANKDIALFFMKQIV